MRVMTSLLGAIAGLLCLIGGAVLLWGSQDALLALIHWIGEERALGPRGVIRNPDGSTLLTNPGAMAKWVFLIWAVGVAQVLSGLSLLWRIAKAARAPSERIG